MPMKKLLFSFLFLLFTATRILAQSKTYCNPINLDYGFTPIPNFSEAGRHRATADPLIVNFKGKYFLFSTNQWGYWWSNDLSKWNFVSRKFLLPHNKVYDELCAPAAWVMGDTLYVIGSTHTKEFAIWKSTNPTVDDWKIAVPAFEGAAWDPGFLYDDDKRLYLYYGSSNTYPLYGWEINPKTLQPIGERKELVRLHDDQHGWERFGDYNDNIFLKPFIEGAWVDKHNGKYYFQYGAPGTEFNGYAEVFTFLINRLGLLSTKPIILFATNRAVLSVEPATEAVSKIISAIGGISQRGLLPSKTTLNDDWSCFQRVLTKTM